MKIDLVQVSCGLAVPYFNFVEEREQLVSWANKKGESGIEKYWEEKNQGYFGSITVNLSGPPAAILLHESVLNQPFYA